MSSNMHSVESLAQVRTVLLVRDFYWIILTRNCLRSPTLSPPDRLRIRRQMRNADPSVRPVCVPVPGTTSNLCLLVGVLSTTGEVDARVSAAAGDVRRPELVSRVADQVVEGVEVGHDRSDVVMTVAGDAVVLFLVCAGAPPRMLPRTTPLHDELAIHLPVGVEHDVDVTALGFAAANVLVVPLQRVAVVVASEDLASTDEDFVA